MYIRIEFKSNEDRGRILPSWIDASNVTPRQCFDFKTMYIAFWYLDVNKLNKGDKGTLESLMQLKLHPGVKSVEILPLEGSIYYAYKDQLESLLVKYISVPFDS